jgi:hypothetical protein
VAWAENLGGTWGPVQAIAVAAHQVRSLSTGDIDGDGDQDVLTATSAGLVRWHENVPRPLHLDVGPLVIGAKATTTTGPSVSTADTWIAYSLSGSGIACPAPLGGACLELDSPVPLGKTTGVLRTPSLPDLPGTVVELQAVQWGGRASNVVRAIVGEGYPLGLDGWPAKENGVWLGYHVVADRPATLLEFGLYLNVLGCSNLDFAVYSGPGWALEYAASVEPTGGQSLRRASPSLPLEVGVEYLVGVGWDSLCEVMDYRDVPSVGAVHGPVTVLGYGKSYDHPALPPAPVAGYAYTFRGALVFE